MITEEYHLEGAPGRQPEALEAEPNGHAPAPPSTALPTEGSREFKERCEHALSQVSQKYAWTAQQDGIVLRHNPLKIAPYRDYVYNRIAKAEYGFHYLDGRGKKRFWYPSFDEVFGLTIEGELDIGLVIAERIEFLPGKEEITHDADGCRVLNLWRPPGFLAKEDAPEPTLFLDHLILPF